MYCLGSSLAVEPGWGPFRLGAVPPPLPFRTQSESPRVKTADGYHSTGMRPSRAPPPAAAEAPAALTLNTATASLSASAMYRWRPSVESANAFGPLPSAGPPGAESRSLATTESRRVSTTAIRSLEAQAT